LASGWINFSCQLQGAGGIILALSNYFGRILADKYVEKTKASLQKEINEYQNKLDILKQTTLRYSDKQFEHLQQALG
jgi:hypothetical protein